MSVPPPPTHPAGDTAAARFQRLLEPHLAALWRTAYRFTGRREDAEDLLQELLTRLYPRGDSLGELADLRSWLLRVLHNLFIDRRRVWRRSIPAHTDSDATSTDIEAMESEEPGPEAQVDAERLSRMVYAALDRLDRDQRAVVVLHDMEGYSLAELQTLLHVPRGTLKSRLFRARHRLRALLQGNLSVGSDV